MPAASTWLVRLALLHLLGGFLIGALLLAAKAEDGLAILPWSWRGAHLEMLVVGFMVQLACGVAFWILPRDADRPPRPHAAWAAAALLNAGVASCAAAAVTGTFLPMAAGRAAEAAAVAIFAAHAWPRVRGARPISAASPARSR